MKGIMYKAERLAAEESVVGWWLDMESSTLKKVFCVCAFSTIDK